MYTQMHLARKQAFNLKASLRRIWSLNNPKVAVVCQLSFKLLDIQLRNETRINFFNFNDWDFAKRLNLWSPHYQRVVGSCNAHSFSLLPHDVRNGVAGNADVDARLRRKNVQRQKARCCCHVRRLVHEVGCFIGHVLDELERRVLNRLKLTRRNNGF